MCAAPFCFLVLFWGQNPSLVLNQRQLVVAMFVCVYVELVREAAYTGIAHWNEISFRQKRKLIHGTKSSCLFLILPIICVRILVNYLLGFYTLLLPSFSCLRNSSKWTDL